MLNISLRAEQIFRLFNFPLTNTLLLSLVASLLLIIGGFRLGRRLSLAPGKIQNVLELGVEEMLKLMDSVLGERRLSEKYLPLVATIFIFILFSNWLGLIPGIGSVGLKEGNGFVPLLRSPASDLNFTLALGVVVVLAINFFGVWSLGWKGHFSKFLNFENPLRFFIGLLELVSEFAKMISFSFRLFGNVFAGDVLLLIMAFLIPYLLPAPFLLLEIFVGFIQAFIFAMLTLIFIAVATAEHEA